MLQRIWSAIVGAVAGTCMGVAAIVVLLMTGSALETGLIICGVAAALGGILGFVLRKPPAR